MYLTFIELSPFAKYRAEFLSDEDYRLFQNELLKDPEKGDVIPGVGGIRKIRISKNNKGKRGGARVIYLYIPLRNCIYLITAYGKGKKTDLSEDDKRMLLKMVDYLKM